MAVWPPPASRGAQAQISSLPFGSPQDHPVNNWVGNQTTVAPTADGSHSWAKTEGGEMPRPNLQVKCLQDGPPPPPQRKIIHALGSH